MYFAKAAANIRIEDDAILVPGQPQDRQVLMDAFARAYPKGGL
jgi:hypothetical protein